MDLRHVMSLLEGVAQKLGPQGVLYDQETGLIHPTSDMPDIILLTLVEKQQKQMAVFYDELRERGLLDGNANSPEV
jgi:hypothetical protein